MDEILIINADYSDPSHCRAIPFLLNEYAKDLLGMKKELEKTVLEELVPELEKVPGALVLLARIKDRFVGMAICFVGFSTFKARPLINIHDFMVQADYQNRGIGKRLMQEIERIALDRRCCKITLEVQENNRSAQRLYSKMGFSTSFLDAEAGGQLFFTKTL